MSGTRSGSRAVVTGSASGIGAAIAEELLARGMTVVGIDLASRGPVDVIPCDLADPAARQRALDAAVATLGGLDVLINCAGTFKAETFDALTDDALRRTLAVNLEAPIMLMRTAGRIMAEEGYGRIVNITSIHARVSEPGSLAYDASKAGLEAASRTSAIELGARGVLVNAVAPGFVATPMSTVDGIDELRTDAFRDTFVETGRLPLRRPAEPSEIAAVVAFLASPANTYVTGAVVVADGGLTARF